jgi:hypothetical protein
MADVTDKKRLRQIQQQDLSESRLNDDFVYWLKTSGPNWGLGLLVIICGYSLLNLYWQRKDTSRDNAWAEFTAATTSNLPESYASVATDHEAVDSVALLSWLSAGDAHLQDLQVGLIAPSVATSADGSVNPPEPLTDETRKTKQDAADSFYGKVYDKLAARKSELAMKPMVIAALFGRAAVAESRGATDAARGFLTEAQTLAGTDFPAFAEAATTRLASLDTLATVASLPTKASLPPKPEFTPVAPSVIDELTRSMTTPVAAPAARVNPQPIPVTPVQPDSPASILDVKPSQPAAQPATQPASPPAGS